MRAYIDINVFNEAQLRGKTAGKQVTVVGELQGRQGRAKAFQRADGSLAVQAGEWYIPVYDADGNHIGDFSAHYNSILAPRVQTAEVVK